MAKQNWIKPDQNIIQFQLTPKKSEMTEIAQNTLDIDSIKAVPFQKIEKPASLAKNLNQKFSSEAKENDTSILNL
jgi:hypothetical protein